MTMEEDHMTTEVLTVTTHQIGAMWQDAVQRGLEEVSEERVFRVGHENWEGFGDAIWVTTRFHAAVRPPSAEDEMKVWRLPPPEGKNIYEAAQEELLRTAMRKVPNLWTASAFKLGQSGGFWDEGGRMWGYTLTIQVWPGKELQPILRGPPHGR